MKLDKLSYSKVEIGVLDFIKSNITFSKGQHQLKDFFDKIIDFNKQNEYLSFFDFCFSQKHNENENPDTLKNSIRVKKTRLNKLLESHNYQISRTYEILQIENISFEHLINEATDKINHIEVKEIKIFDSFDNEKKHFLYNDINRRKVEYLIKREKITFEAISIINTTETKEFYEKLLLEDDFNIKVKYLRHPIMANSPILFVLITDKNDEHYIFYYEHVTCWSVLTHVNSKIEFSDKFYTLLNSRFNYFFNDRNLEELNHTLTIKKETFKKSFPRSVNHLIHNIEKLFKHENLSENEIKDNINKLLKILITMKVSFPNMNHNFNILYHHIRLLETALMLHNTDKLENTQIVLEQLIKTNLFENLNARLLNESSKEELLLKNNVFNDVKVVRTLLYTLSINQYQHTIVDIFDKMYWNTQETIIDSFNIILQDYKMLLKFINAFLNKKSRDRLLKYDDMLLLKYIARKIMVSYNIPMPKSIPIVFIPKENKLLARLEFHNELIEKQYYN